MGGISSNETWKVDEEVFERCRALGKGSYGKVLAVLTQDKQFRAMKMFSKKKILDKDILKVIKREKQIMQLAQGAPFVVPLYRTFQTDHEIFIVLGLLEGGDLRFHQDEHEIFPEHVLKFWCAQLTLCIEGMHQLGVIHRDIKPENVLLDMKGYCHLSDFTGAVHQPSDEREIDPTYIGTIWYMAYEVLMDEASGKEVDWWSLGATLYELAVGTPPFAHVCDGIPTRDKQYPVLAKAFQENELEFPENLSDHFKDFISSLLELDPDARMDGDEIRTHPWMDGIKWDAIASRTATAPFLPHTDRVNFHVAAELDDAFEMDTVVGHEKVSLKPSEQAQFNDWDWMNPKLYKETLRNRALKILSSPEQLKKGLFLWEKGFEGTTGRVLFFADDLPEKTIFVTQDGVTVSRIGNTLYVDETHVINI